METVVNAPSRVTSLATGAPIFTTFHLAAVRTESETCTSQVDMLKRV